MKDRKITQDYSDNCAGVDQAEAYMMKKTNSVESECFNDTQIFRKHAHNTKP